MAIKLKKIVGIEYTGKEEDVYDIEVESPQHRFIAKSKNGAIGISHNSATISLSNLSDERMRNAKNGQWWIDNPQRALANNSVAYTEKPDIEMFIKEWLSLIESKSGERGIFNRVSIQKKASQNGRRKSELVILTNPCGEISLRNNGFCNLSEVVIREDDTLETLKEKVKVATIIGTFQSTLTNFRYLRSIWKKNAEEERLLGVSLTGIMDHPILSKISDTAKEWLTILKDVVYKTNEEWANKIGIEQSVAMTTGKPSGCQGLDNVIKTTAGDMTVRSIFEMVGYTEEDMKGMEREWLEVDCSKLPKVYDDNNDEQRITKLFVNGLEPVYEIEFIDGNKYRFTGNHYLKLSNSLNKKDFWKRMDLILPYELISAWENNAQTIMDIKSIIKLSYKEITCDIEVENTHCYQLKNGVISHNTVAELVNSSSGIHPRYAPYYIRTVRADKADPLAKLMQDVGVPNEPDIMNPNNTLVFSFIKKSPDNSIMRNNINAIEQLEHYKMFRENWCDHNMSITIYVKQNEWLEVGNWIWKNWDDISGVSFLPYSEHSYKQAPFQEISKELYEQLKEKEVVIDFNKLGEYEKEDNTVAQREYACSAGACELI